MQGTTTSGERKTKSRLSQGGPGVPIPLPYARMQTAPGQTAPAVCSVVASCGTRALCVALAPIGMRQNMSVCGCSANDCSLQSCAGKYVNLLNSPKHVRDVCESWLLVKKACRVLDCIPCRPETCGQSLTTSDERAAKSCQSQDGPGVVIPLPYARMQAASGKLHQRYVMWSRLAAQGRYAWPLLRLECART